MDDLDVEDLARPGTVFQIGIAPSRIDVLTSIDAVAFDEAWSSCVETSYGGVQIRLLGLDLLIRNKRAVGRDQDRIDLAKLEQRQKLDESSG